MSTKEEEPSSVGGVKEKDDGKNTQPEPTTKNVNEDTSDPNDNRIKDPAQQHQDEVQFQVEAAVGNEAEHGNEAATLHSGSRTKIPVTTTRGKFKMATIKKTKGMDYKTAYYDTLTKTPSSDKDLLVKDVTPPIASYASMVTSPYIQNLQDRFSNLEKGMAMDTSTSQFQENLDRSLTVWAPLGTTVTQTIVALQGQFKESTNQLVLGIERDSRVKSISKINIVLANDIACHHLTTNGMVINGQRLYPKASRPRPPPSRRAYLPNFPVAANPEDLEEAATNQGINILRIEPRRYKDTAIKIGGMTLWADLDSTTPQVLYFNNEEYAMIWRGKRTTAKSEKTTNRTAESDETTSAKSGKTTQRTAQPAETTTHTARPVETRQPAKPDETRQPAKSDETTTPPEEKDVEMQLVLSKNQKKKMKKNGKLEQPRKSNQQKNKDTTNEQSITREEYTDIDKLADVSLGENQILFSNFNHDTSQASIKNFLETQGIKGTPIEFFVENFRLRRAVLVKVHDLKATVSYTYLCEEKEYEHVNKIYARCVFGSSCNSKVRALYGNIR